jgi:HK97 family phage major capsid protein
MNPRLAEILKRKEEIRTALQGTEKVDLKAFEEELRQLDAEQKEIEERERVASSINVGAPAVPVITKEKPAEKRSMKVYETPEYRDAFLQYVKDGTPIPAELRSDAVTTTGDVGALIPATTMNKVIEKLTTYGNIIPLVTRTAYKTGVAIPTSDVKPKAVWVAEGAGSEKQKKALGEIVFAHYKLRCAVAVTLETEYMTLSAFEAALVDNMAEAMAVALEEAIIKGTGSGQPTGIIADTTKGTLINVASIDYKTLTQAEAALPQAYEAGSVWIMTKKTFMEFIGMTDKNGQPIARITAGVDGKPSRFLLGRSVELCDYLPDYASTLKKTDVFAFIYRMKDYDLNTNFSVSMRVYEDHDTDDVIRKSIIVCDGKPVDYNSLVMLAGNTAS